MIKAILIDDEIDAIKTLENFLKDFCSGVEIVAEAQDIPTAVAAIDQYQPDLVFLDINLRRGTGFDILSRTSFKEFKTIFTTAHENFALEAFKVKAFGYLVKPVNPLELQNIVEDVSGIINKDIELEELRKSLSPAVEKRIGLPYKNETNLTSIDDIIRLEAESNYTKVHLKDGSSVLVAKTLKKFEQILIDYQFKRVHQSHLINLSFIKSFNTKSRILILSDGSEVPISKRLKKELINDLELRFPEK
ncbi:MAG: LytTR family DNA-binding domain-containing protein [Bacteroidota bacterium]